MIDREFLRDTNRQFQRLIEGSGRQCPSCESVFLIENETDKRKYCSAYCWPGSVQRRKQTAARKERGRRERARRIRERQSARPTYGYCEFCDGRFFWKPNKRFCGSKCRTNYSTQVKQQKLALVPCSRCQEPFRRTHALYHRCPTCRSSPRPSEPRFRFKCKAPGCTTEVVTNTSRKSYCSARCRKNVAWARVKKSRQKETLIVTRSCKKCGAEFQAESDSRVLKCDRHRFAVPSWDAVCKNPACEKPYRTNRPRQCYCTIDCRKAHETVKRNSGKEQRVCRRAGCGVSFPKRKNIRYCSDACREAVKRAVMMDYEARRRKVFVEISCGCGSRFTPKRCHQKYCPQCIKRRRGGMKKMAACKICGDPFFKQHQNQQKCGQCIANSKLSFPFPRPCGGAGCTTVLTIMPKTQKKKYCSRRCKDSRSSVRGLQVV